jgi:hypothetical protein
MELAILFFACVGLSTCVVASLPWSKQVARPIRHWLIKKMGGYTRTEYNDLAVSLDATEVRLRIAQAQLEQIRASRPLMRLRIAQAQLEHMKRRYDELEKRIEDTESNTAPLRRKRSFTPKEH